MEIVKLQTKHQYDIQPTVNRHIKLQFFIICTYSVKIINIFFFTTELKIKFDKL